MSPEVCEQLIKAVLTGPFQAEDATGGGLPFWVTLGLTQGPWPSGLELLLAPPSPGADLGLCSIPPWPESPCTSLPHSPQPGCLSSEGSGAWLAARAHGGGSNCQLLSMGSTGRLLGMSQDRFLVTAALAGTVEVTLQKWLALAAGNFSGEGKWVWALGSSEALPGMGTLFAGSLRGSLFL